MNKLWQPNKLIEDETDVAYEPTDKEGKQLARALTLQLRLIMWRAKMGNPRDHVPPWTPLNCRCVIRPIK